MVILSLSCIIVGIAVLLIPKRHRFVPQTNGTGPRTTTSPVNSVLLVAPGRLRRSTLWVTAAIGVAGLFSVASNSALPLLVGGGLSVLLIVRQRSQKTRRRQATLLDNWPEVLDDLRIRVGAFGEPLPQATFVSLRRLGPQLTTEVGEAERIWTLTGSYHDALSYLDRSLADLASSSVFDSLKLCSEIGGTDISRRLEDLRQTRDAERLLLHEVQAKLGAVRLARTFVIVVPCAMALVGGLLSGSLHPFLTPLGIGIDSLSGLLILGCWIWSTALMKPPSRFIGAPKVRSRQTGLSALERLVTQP